MNFGMTFVESLIGGRNLNSVFKFKLENNSNKFEISN
jgi:hypothetical protein